MVKQLSFFILLTLMGCSASTPSKPSIVVDNIHIQDVGSDPGGEICEGFSLDASQVKHFFSQAQNITFKQLHDEFDYLPCFVKGTLIQQGQSCSFSIRAGATAELSCSDGTQSFYACTACDNLFIAK